MSSAMDAIRSEARIAAQIAVEQTVRGAAEFGWSSAVNGMPLETARADVVVIVHEAITELVDVLLSTGALMERAS